jgi:hypothetical protein
MERGAHHEAALRLLNRGGAPSSQREAGAALCLTPATGMAQNWARTLDSTTTMNTSPKTPIVLALLLCLAAGAWGQNNAAPGTWVPLFNGKDLTGWTPKIKGYPLGENFGNTFRFTNGVLQVAYDQYPKFDSKFGHLFWKEKLSNYMLRVEYRFVGQQTPGGPGWAFRNSGVMLHCQPPESMGKDQDFPVSIEVQLLGGDGKNTRPTANLCTPGTHVVMDGKLFTPHCTSSSSKTYHGDQWVTVELEVRGNKLIKHIVEGQTVLSYGQPQLDDSDPDARKLAQLGPKQLSGGYISLQAESHPVEFRKVELLKLEE